MKKKKINRIVLTKSHFRTFVTMDQLAEKMKTCRSAIDHAVARFLATTLDADVSVRLDTKPVRTGKRGPATRAYRLTRAS